MQIQRQLISVIFVILWVGIVAKESNADIQSSDTAVREAVGRSLTYLEKEGVAWMNNKNRGCMSCHHVPFLVWSHRTALRYGLKVDEQKLDEWEKWCQQDSLKQRNLYRLQAYELGKVDVATLPMPIKDKLQPLVGQPFKVETEFVEKLKPLLTAEELQAHQAIIVKTAERPLNHPDRAGGGLDVLGQLLIGGNDSNSEIIKPEFRAGVVELMQRLQRPDGSWMPGNQFLSMRRWPVTAADQTTTMWATLALGAYESSQPKRSDTVEKAVAYQRQQPVQSDNYEWLATRLLFEKQFGSAEEVAKLTQQLLEARQADGGWSWEKGIASNAFTTGLAIYVLAKVGGDHAAVFRDARRYLLSQQEADGSWKCLGKNFSKSNEHEALDEIYHYWGTAWAAIGLLETIGKAGDETAAVTK